MMVIADYYLIGPQRKKILSLRGVLYAWVHVRICRHVYWEFADICNLNVLFLPNDYYFHFSKFQNLQFFSIKIFISAHKLFIFTIVEISNKNWLKLTKVIKSLCSSSYYPFFSLTNQLQERHVTAFSFFLNIYLFSYFLLLKVIQC